MVELGRISSVKPEPEAKRVYVSVRVAPSQDHPDIPFVSGQSGLWMVPSEGDIVEVYEVGGSYVARTPHNKAAPAMPAFEEGDFCLRLDGDTELYFSKQSDGTFDLSLTTGGDVTIEGAQDSTVHVDGGDVVIGDDANAAGVAKKDHTHDYEGGGDNSNTKTSTPPNESPTDTQIE